mmetsp:Transcript_106975/g.300893  ORF Transcript_106975/g.300893 Transcript_106975/m.300893 type:complete len:226 (-) Transcript_106975:47-724(-)
MQGPSPAMCSAFSRADEKAPRPGNPSARPNEPMAWMVNMRRKNAEAQRSCAPAGGAAKRSTSCPIARVALSVFDTTAKPLDSRLSVTTSPVVWLTAGTSAPKHAPTRTEKTVRTTVTVVRDRPTKVTMSGVPPRAWMSAKIAKRFAGAAAAMAAHIAAQHDELRKRSDDASELKMVPRAMSTKPVPKDSCKRTDAKPKPTPKPSVSKNISNNDMAQLLTRSRQGR